MDFKDLLNEWANDAGVDAELVEGMVQIVEAHITDTNTKLTAEVNAQLTEKHAADLEAEKSKHKEDLEVKEKEYTEKLEEATVDLYNQVSEYADYVAEQFQHNHAKQLVETSEYEQMKTLVENIKFAFTGLDLSSHLDLRLEENQKTIQELQTALTEAKEKAQVLERSKLFESATKGLSDIDVEKVQKLVESNSNFVGDYKVFVESLVSLVSNDTKTQDEGNVITEQTNTKPTNTDYLTFIQNQVTQF